MDPSAGVADLHVHTTASDGTSSVAERVAQARDRDLDVVGITDHDTISDDLTEPVSRRDGVEVITGVEVRADVAGTKIEILGYFVSPDSDQLRDVLARARRFRHERNAEMVDQLNTVTELDLDYDEIRATAGDSVGRPHFAAALVEAGLVASINEAFEQYLAPDCPAYVPMERQEYTTVIDAVHTAGGVASLAHPGRIHSDRVPEIVEELAGNGLDAIEVVYPYDRTGPDRQNEIGVAEARDLARTHDLLETGGSDCHGPESGKFRLGEYRVSSDDLAALRAAADRDPR